MCIPLLFLFQHTNTLIVFLLLYIFAIDHSQVYTWYINILQQQPFVNFFYFLFCFLLLFIQTYKSSCLLFKYLLIHQIRYRVIHQIHISAKWSAHIFCLFVRGKCFTYPNPISRTQIGSVGPTVSSIPTKNCG